MKKAYILIGPSGAGKSTFTKTVIEDATNENTVAAVFSLDACRIQCFEDQHADNYNLPQTDKYKAAFEWAMNNEKEFDAFVKTYWAETLEGSEIVVVDNTNSSRKSRARWSQDLKKAGFHVVMVEFLVTLKTVLARQKTRTDKSVPAAIVLGQYMRQEAALKGSECDSVLVVRSE